MNRRVVILGLREAVEREKFARAAAFIPIYEKICGIEVRPMEIQHVINLDMAGCIFISGWSGGGMSNRQLLAHIHNFLWTLHPRYSPDAIFRREWFFHRIRKLDTDTVIDGIFAFINEAFADADAPGGKPNNRRPSYYCLAAVLVDMLASEYGWSEKAIMRVKLKRAFQYRNAILKRRNPNTILFNPSDKIKGDWLNAFDRRC